MRLSRKLTAALVLGVLIVMALYGYAQLRNEVLLSEADLNRAHRLGQVLRGFAEGVLAKEGPARLQELNERANERTEGLTLRVLNLDEVETLRATGLDDAQVAKLDAGEVVRTIRTDADGNDWVYAYVDLEGGKRSAVVEAVETLAPEQSYIRTSHAAIGLATLGIVLVCGLIATLLQYWFVGKPIEALRDKARRAGQGDFSRPLELRQRDEIGELATDINTMCDEIATAHGKLREESEARISTLEQLRHSERLATIGRLAAGVAHELGTPLNVVSARAELLAARELPFAEVGRQAAIIREQTERMSGIIQQLLDFSRRRSAKPGLAKLSPLVESAADLLSSTARRGNVSVRCQPTTAPLFAFIDQNQMLQAVANVMLNAIQAMPEGGELTISVSSGHAVPPREHGGPVGEYLCIRVDDTGLGITPERLPHIFEPFFTTKSPGQGTGLGLAVTHGIVSEHGGWIGVESELGKGSSFSIFLPVPGAGEVKVA